MDKDSGEVDLYINAGELAKNLSIEFDIDATSETNAHDIVVSANTRSTVPTRRRRSLAATRNGG